MFVLTADHGAGAAMRDPMNWALPLFRVFGIAVRLHVLFPVITLGLFLRLYYDSKNVYSGGDLFAFIVVVPFIIILLHEFGHCFAARSVGGSADQILMWPLGGLAFVNIPETPRAHAITTIWGPLVNLLICIACSIAFIAGGYSPLGALNPVANPFTTHIHNFDGRTYTSGYDAKYYRAGTSVAVAPAAITLGPDLVLREAGNEAVTKAVAPSWVVWNWRVCWMSWWLFLFNMLIPAYPMDCGRLLHAFLWNRTDNRTASITCGYVGYGTAFIMMIVGIATNESILLMLAVFIIVECYRVLNGEMSEAGAFGYDFSQGYTSLDRDEEKPAPPPRKQGFIKRWLHARQVRKLKSEHEERIADDARMDELLEKIARSGKASLTEEEHRFMARVSARYRNRSS